MNDDETAAILAGGIISFVFFIIVGFILAISFPMMTEIAIQQTIVTMLILLAFIWIMVSVSIYFHKN